MNYILTEQHIYGSSRLGVDRRNVDVIAAGSPSDNVSLSVKRGEKHYELSNHLGNVLANIGDRKFSVKSGAESFIPYFISTFSFRILKPQTLISKFQFPNSSPAPMTERTAVVTPTDVRYGFNGKEVDSEGMGGGLSTYDYGFRIYNPHIAKFLSVDPLVEQTKEPYSFCYNNPLRFVDPDGRSGQDWVKKGNGDIYWDNKATSQATTKEGETYLGKTHQREKIWNNVNVRGNIENGLMSENYNSNGKMTYENKTPWMDKAFEEMSKNISETGSNPEITKYWAHTQMPEAAANGDTWAASVLKEDQTPWCAAFVNFNLETSGVEGTNMATAYSFKGYGQDLGKSAPVYGSIAVMNYSHVGFVAGTNKDGRIILLGGNQGNAVNLSPNGQSAVIKYVYPSGQTPTNSALPQYNLQGRSLTNATSR